jgi:hypothetical protein
MPIQAVTGEINSQVLNDNYAYLDSQKLEKEQVKKVFVEDFGAVGDGVTDDTIAIQSAIDNLPDGYELIFAQGKEYLVSKNSSLTGFPKGDQPCLFINNKHGLKLKGFGSVIKVNTHAQGILEIQGSSFISAEGIEFKGPNTYPALDGTTGRGEKGTSTEGYNTAPFWGFHKNNSYDSGLGTFNGGYIGNSAFGVLIQNSSNNILFTQCKANGFNFSGFGVGFKGDDTYPDSENIKFVQCVVDNNYNANLLFCACNHVVVQDCTISNAGHPNSLLTDGNVDPGYGITCTNTLNSMPKNIYVKDNIMIGNKRKAVDAHTVEGFYVTGNQIEDSWVTGVFAKWSDGQQTVKNIIISQNVIKNSGIHSSSNSVISVGSSRSTFYTSNQYLNANVSDNILITNGGGIDVGTFDKVVVCGNIVDGVHSSANAVFAGISLGTGTSTERNNFVSCSGNLIDSKSALKMDRGISVRYTDSGTVTDNTIKLLNTDAYVGLYAVGCEYTTIRSNVVVLGSNGTPVVDTQTKGVAENIGIGGNGTIKQATGQRIHFLLLANGGNGTLTSYSGGNLIDSVVSDTNGLRINFKSGISNSIRPFVSISMQSSNGLVTSTGTNHDYFYNRGADNTGVTIGIKTSYNSSHTPFSSLTSGGIEVIILL